MKRKRKPARAAHKSKGAAVVDVAAASHEPAAPADTRLDPLVEHVVFGGRPDEPPPALVPPEVQHELDRLIRINRALRAAIRCLLEEEP